LYTYLYMSSHTGLSVL